MSFVVIPDENSLGGVVLKKDFFVPSDIQTDGPRQGSQEVSSDHRASCTTPASTDLGYKWISPLKGVLASS